MCVWICDIFNACCCCGFFKTTVLSFLFLCCPYCCPLQIRQCHDDGVAGQGSTSHQTLLLMSLVQTYGKKRFFFTASGVTRRQQRQRKIFLTARRLFILDRLARTKMMFCRRTSKPIKQQSQSHHRR